MCVNVDDDVSSKTTLAGMATSQCAESANGGSNPLSAGSPVCTHPVREGSAVLSMATARDYSASTGASLPLPSLPASVPRAAAESRLHYLEALVQASNAINGTLDPARVADVLAARTSDLLDVSGVIVMMIDERGCLQVGASHGLSRTYVNAQTGPLEENIVGRALAEERIFAAWDAREIPDARLSEAARTEGIVSVACAPMVFGGKAIGAVGVYCRESREFTDDQFHVLMLLASQGAVALTNARAYRTLDAQANEVRASFQRVGEALSASLDIGETLRLIVQLAGDMTKADGGAMLMLEDENKGGGMRLAGMRGLDRRSVRRFRNAPESPLAARALAARRVIVVRDTRRVTDTAFPTLRMGADETAEVRSVVCVPIVVGSRPVGVLEQYGAEVGSFSKADIQLLSSFALQASVAIENARLYAQERNVAQTLQRAFLPELPYAINGFEIGRIYAPGSEIAAVGGDTYDLFALPDGRIAILMADVSGQGTQAATLAVMAKYTVRAYCLQDPNPSRVLSLVNDALIPQTDDSTFLTLCFGLIDPVARTITLARAAHPPAMLWRRAEGVTRPVEVLPGLIAGYLYNQDYPSEVITLDPGDVIVLYTDGVIEARRQKVMFSNDERLERIIEQCAHTSAQEIASSVYNAVVDWAEGERLDDIALLVLKAN